MTTEGTSAELTDEELADQLKKNKVMQSDIEMLYMHGLVDEAVKRGYDRSQAFNGRLVRP
jgi:hypothetical protein